MTSQYLLPCECGEKVAVDTRQAGQSVSCPNCNRPNVVPTLRKLSQLESVADAKQVSGPRPSWTPLQGSLFVIGAMVLFFSLIATAHMSFRYWSLGPTSARFSEEEMDNELSQITPSGSWEVWMLFKQWPLSRDSRMNHLVNRRSAATMRRYIAISAAACIVGAIALASSLLLRDVSKRR